MRASHVDRDIEKVDWVLFGEIVDQTAWRRSLEVDAPSDRRWFFKNPREYKRKRKPSVFETKAFGLAEGSEVVVRRNKCGEQWRTFLLPKSADRSIRPKTANSKLPDDDSRAT